MLHYLEQNIDRSGLTLGVVVPAVEKYCKSIIFRICHPDCHLFVLFVGYWILDENKYSSSHSHHFI